MEMHNINNKYGNGATCYFLSNDNKLITKFYVKEHRSFDLADFLDRIDNDKFNRITLVYYGNKENPYIKGIVNGRVKFTIDFNREQLKEVNSNIYNNKLLERLMKKTINGKEYDDMKMTEYISLTNNKLPNNAIDLNNYKNFIEVSLKDSKANIVTHFIELLAPFYCTGGAVLMQGASIIVNNYNGEFSQLLTVGCGAIVGLAAYNAVNLLLNKRYENVLYEISMSRLMIQHYNNEIDKIYKAELKGVRL